MNPFVNMMVTPPATTQKVTKGPSRGTKSQRDLRKHLQVGGRLQRFKRAWKGSSVDRIISRGLIWLWARRPPPLQTLSQHTSSAIDIAIRKMYKKKVIMKAKRILFQSRLFTVPKRDSTEERLILDLSCLNGYIHCPTFKMLTLKDISAILPPGYWTVSLDLKDGFWHVNIFHKLRPYLGFRYRGQLYQFRAMPFGLNLAPLTFTKLIAHMVKVLEEEGIWCLPFLDDLLILAPSKEECLAHLK